LTVFVPSESAIVGLADPVPTCVYVEPPSVEYDTPAPLFDAVGVTVVVVSSVDTEYDRVPGENAGVSAPAEVLMLSSDDVVLVVKRAR
jgi:hypothetical protein